MFARVTPNLMMPDVNRTLEYYRDILGFDFVIGVPHDSQEIIAQYDSTTPLAFALMQQGSVQFMFQSQQSFLEEIPQLRTRP
jgi:catechol 2,3-dioxygenase-like lactoylglutathione lyase family enzyme